ncbi:MAG: hypothetical protein ACR2LL_04810 [Nitrosopumilus sp.]
MKINRLVPIVSTEILEESKEFYIKYFDFQVLFANDWYVLLESKNKCPNCICHTKPQNPTFNISNQI